MKKRQAKMETLSNLSKEMGKLMGEDYAKGLGKMKKVTVASDSEEGLKEGLSKAQEIMRKKLGKDADKSEDDSDESEDMEMEDEKVSENDDMDESCEDMTSDELKAKIKRLQQKMSPKG